MDGRLHDLGVFLTDMAVLGTTAPRCCWDAPITGSVCGEPASHFVDRMVDLDLGVRRYEYRCEKHVSYDAAVDRAAGDTCDDLLQWEDVLQEARKAETKEQILVILERQERIARLWHEAYSEYAERLLALAGSGTIEEIDRAYRATIGEARRRIVNLRNDL